MVVQRFLYAAIGRRIGPTSARGLLDMEPLREFLADTLPSTGLEANLATGRLRAVALTATSYSSIVSWEIVRINPSRPPCRSTARRGRLVISNVAEARRMRPSDWFQPPPESG